MTNAPRIVLDTNVLISRLIMPNSASGRAVRLAMETGCVLASEATMTELADVLARRKFDAYVRYEERLTFLRLLYGVIVPVSVLPRVQACRDPKADKFLELAIGGAAEMIITGDADLLMLDPFRGTRIMTPTTYLKHMQGEAGKRNDPSSGQ